MENFYEEYALYMRWHCRQNFLYNTTHNRKVRRVELVPDSANKLIHQEREG